MENLDQRGEGEASRTIFPGLFCTNRLALLRLENAGIVVATALEEGGEETVGTGSPYPLFPLSAEDGWKRAEKAC